MTWILWGGIWSSTERCLSPLYPFTASHPVAVNVAPLFVPLQMHSLNCFLLTNFLSILFLLLFRFSQCCSNFRQVSFWFKKKCYFLLFQKGIFRPDVDSFSYYASNNCSKAELFLWQTVLCKINTHHVTKNYTGCLLWFTNENVITDKPLSNASFSTCIYPPHLRLA